MTKDNSGSAFPHKGIDTGGVLPPPIHSGLTKREWFAGMCLNACVTAMCEDNAPNWDAVYRESKVMAYEMADAMLEASEE